jgi:hypothetical protein
LRKSVRHANTRIVYPKEDPIIHSAPSRPVTKHTSLLFELKPVAIRAAATTRATMALTMVEETFVILIISSCVNGMFVKFGYKLRRVRVSNSKSVRKIFRQDIMVHTVVTCQLLVSKDMEIPDGYFTYFSSALFAVYHFKTNVSLRQ